VSRDIGNIKIVSSKYSTPDISILCPRKTLAVTATTDMATSMLWLEVMRAPSIALSSVHMHMVGDFICRIPYQCELDE